jgi:hypothetical protein
MFLVLLRFQCCHICCHIWLAWSYSPYFMGWYPRQESNLDLEFRKPLFYPLNYGDGWLDFP